jgi:hypothetical protein
MCSTSQQAGVIRGTASRHIVSSAPSNHPRRASAVENSRDLPLVADVNLAGPTLPHIQAAILSGSCSGKRLAASSIAK